MVLSFSFKFLAFDTQLLMGKKRYNISPEEYIFATLNIYLDVVYIFSFILQLFGMQKDWAEILMALPINALPGHFFLPCCILEWFAIWWRSLCVLLFTLHENSVMLEYFQANLYQPELLVCWILPRFPILRKELYTCNTVTLTQKVFLEWENLITCKKILRKKNRNRDH